MSDLVELAGKRVRIHRVFTPDIAIDVTASTAVVNLTDYSDGGTTTDITDDTTTTTPSEGNVDVVVNWPIPDDAASGWRVITIDVDGVLEDAYEEHIYVLARVDQPPLVVI